VAKRDKEEREERARVAKRDREERSRVEREEESERVIRQKIEGGKEITIYVNAWAIDRKLGHIKLVVNSRDSILLVKSMIESVVGLTTHEMIISNASDEEMSDEKSLAMYKVAMGTFVIIKRRF
jgi:acetolactate synthase regulatory subunit